MNINPATVSVLESARSVAAVSRHVTISGEGVDSTAMKVITGGGGI